MSSDDIAIRVRNLSKSYQIYETPRDRLKQFVLPRLQLVTGQAPKQYYRDFRALNNVSFDVRKGETVGIIGRNGSGKSTLLQIICGTLSPTGGTVETRGRIAALLELGSGFNPDFTGRENVYMNAAVLGFANEEIEERFDTIADFAEIGDFIDQPVKTYSSGMVLRLAFAVQAHIDASIVVIDEALAVGDVFFHQKCYVRLEELRASGAAILLVSHSMPDIEQYCERAILLDHGAQKFVGSASEAAKHYYLLHQPVESRIAPQKGALLPHGQGSTIGDYSGRPAESAFLDISDKAQVNNGQARCTKVALCNVNGDPCNLFRQGDIAVFFYEFELSEHIGVPVCGIVISNERGAIVHGKNSWQFDDEVAPSADIGSRVACRQEVKLDLAPGEYVFEIGLASVSETTWKIRKSISHDEMSARRTRICHIASVSSFSIGLKLHDGVPTLTHHGMANLQGAQTVSIRYE
jgi:lipopolysaccharide transport system ATP-binding protein